VSDVVSTVHISVLLNEFIELLSEHFESSKPLRFFDGTFGGGGHTRAVLERFKNASVVAFDRDDLAIARGAKLKEQYGERLSLMHQSFSELGEDLEFDCLLCDLGISSDQLDDRKRGFSFNIEGDLDMRMDQTRGSTALEILNEWSYPELLTLFERGGLRRNVKKLVSQIVEERPLEGGEQFVRICEETFGTPRERRLKRERGGSDSHPATVPFQALRIAVNDELGELNAFLEKLPEVTAPGGIASFITFHSLEDELVTRQFRTWSRAKNDRMLGEIEKSLGEHLTQKPILPSETEIEQNSRSRSARLRAFKFRGVA